MYLYWVSVKVLHRPFTTGRKGLFRKLPGKLAGRIPVRITAGKNCKLLAG